MKFYVIYSFDTSNDIEDITYYYPPNYEKWDQTEGDESYEFNYLADESQNSEYKDGYHRKFVATLDKKEFLEFQRDCNIWFEDIETLGSLTEMGWLPAFSFDGDGDSYKLIYQGAYVTPFPEPVKDYKQRIHGIMDGTWPQMAIWEYSEEELKAYDMHKEEKNWNRLRDAFKSMFG